MPEIGEKRMGTISGMEEVYKICADCEQNYWSRIDKNYQYCRACGTKVGREVNIEGFVYVRIASDDPYLEMCPKRINVFATGDWLRRARYVMAQKLGRCLTADEQVFHRSEDKADDRPENLILHTITYKPEQSEEQVRKTRAYKFGYGEGYEVGYEEGYRESNGKVLFQPKPSPVVEKLEMPRPMKKPTREEAAANLEYWQEKAKERREKC